ncbi:MAG: hypothetical protein E7488_04545 [Ruminococcaceae bacterium]|nr:hypothetical protein [Oscillospiraceae bacterium]
MVVYIDVLIIINFLISYFFLIAAAVLAGYTYNRKRIVFASSAGALCCLYIFFPADSIFLSLIFKSGSLLLCSVIAFGIKDKRKLIIQSLCYFMLNMLLTGSAMLLSYENTVVYEKNMFFYFSINPVILVILSAVIYLAILIFELIKEKVSPQKIYLMDVYFGSFSIKGLSAFYDSGFKMKDIVSNRDVIVVGFGKISNRMPENLAKDIAHFLNGNYSDIKEGFIPVFFSTLSGSGMMPAIKIEHITIDNKIIKNVLVAFTENELSENVTVIFGTDIKKQL